MKHGFDFFLVVLVIVALAVSIVAEEWPHGFDAMSDLIVSAVDNATDLVAKTKF
jgi:hypothetical protein